MAVSFVCGRCRKVMCPDCRQIADEYAELLRNHQRAAMVGTDLIEDLRRQLAAAERNAKAFEEIAKLGYPDVIQQWMDSLVAARTTATHVR